MNTKLENAEYFIDKITSTGGGFISISKERLIKFLVDFQKEMLFWGNNDVDCAYIMGSFNTGGIDGLNKELKRLKDMNLKPHEVVRIIRKAV